MSCNYDNIKTELSKLTDSRLKNTVIDTVDALVAFKEFMKAVEKPMGNTQSQSTSYMQDYARKSANKLEIAFMPSMVMDSEAFSEGLSSSPKAKDMYESFMETVIGLRDAVTNKDKNYNAIKNLVHGNTKSEYYPVYTATVVGTLGWLAENYSTLNTVSSLEDFPIEIGENASAEANAELNRLVASGGMYAAFAADEIGKKIANVLGVQDVSDSTSQELQDNYKRFIAGLGEMGLMLLAKQGYIKEPTSTLITKSKNGEYNKLKARIKDGEPNKYGYADLSVLHADEANSKSRDMIVGWVELTDKSREVQPDYEVIRVITDAAVLETESREPLLEKPKEVKSVKVKNQPLATAKQDLVDAVNMYNSVEWEMNDDAIREIDDLVASEEVMLRLVKYPETDDNVSLDTKLATKGKQRSAMAIVENFKKYSKELSGKGFWFNWFVAKNDRMMISSNTINPQSDKHLARWLMNPKGVGNLLDWNTVSGILDGSSTVVDETNLHEWEYVYGLVQGLGGLKIDGLNIPSIDKSTPKDVVAAAKGIVDIGYAGIKSLMKDHINGGGKFDHFGQAVLALNELGKHGSDKPIKMFIEVDGLTNGLAFKMMQFPVPGVTALMDKVGIRDINETKGSMAEVKASGEELDIYETLGKELQGLLKNRVAQIGEEKYAALQAEFSEILMPLADINSDKVTSDMRNESKPPVMTSSYSASIKTVIKNRNTDKAIKLADRIVKNPASAAKVIQSMIATSGVVLKTGYVSERIPPHLIVDYSEWMTKGLLDSNKIVQSLQNKQVSSTPLVAMVKALISEVEGIDPADGTTTYQLAVDKVTGIWNTGNDAVNAMNEYVFDMVHMIYRKKVADSVDKSNEAKIAIARELVEIWPSLAGPTGNGIKDRTLLIGTKGEFGEGSNKIQAQLIGKGDMQLVVDALERDWKGPGAGSLPIATHSMDSIVQAIVTKRLKEKYGDGYIPFLNIFDAATSYGNSFEYTKMYNEVWYEVNAKYSIMDDFNTTWTNFHNYVEALDDNDSLKHAIASATEKWESKKLKIKHEKGVAPGRYQDVVELQAIVTRDVAEGREILLDKDLKIGQMGGLSGTMVEINGQASKDAVAKSKAEVEIMKLQTSDKKKFNEFLAAEKITVEELIEEFTKVFRGCI